MSAIQRVFQAHNWNYANLAIVAIIFATSPGVQWLLIKTLGFGLLAVCRENYLTAGHNKSHYVAPSLDEQKLPPAAQLFKTMSDKVRKLPCLASEATQSSPASSLVLAG